MTSSFSREVKRALAGTDAIAKSDVLRWMRDGDLLTRARVYHLTAKAWSRIQPELTMDEQCDFMADYLLECIESNPDPQMREDYLHSGFDAGHSLTAWLKHLVARPEAARVIADVAARLEKLYRAGNEQTRTRIEQGALEHILEKPALRPYFSHWQRDPVLREAYEPALLWGLEHTDEP